MASLRVCCSTARQAQSMFRIAEAAWRPSKSRRAQVEAEGVNAGKRQEGQVQIERSIKQEEQWYRCVAVEIARPGSGKTYTAFGDRSSHFFSYFPRALALRESHIFSCVD